MTSFPTPAGPVTGCGICCARRVFTLTPTWCCRRRSTGSPSAPRRGAHRRPRPLLAIGMNGEPLPTEHGYPGAAGGPGFVRLRLGHQVGRRPRADPIRPRQAYWTRLGWSARGADQDRVAHRRPASGQDVAGPGDSAGWPGRRTAVSRRSRCASTTVTGSRPNSGASYRTTPGGCGASPGRPTPRGCTPSRVRATDDTGAVQTSERASPIPDGATGWHTVSFAVKSTPRIP